MSNDLLKHIQEQTLLICLETNNKIIMPEHLLYALLRFNSNNSITSLLDKNGITKKVVYDYLLSKASTDVTENLKPDCDNSVREIFAGTKNICDKKEIPFSYDYAMLLIFQNCTERDFFVKIKAENDDIDYVNIAKKIHSIIDNESALLAEFNNYGCVLNEVFKNNELPLIVGRDNEIGHVIESLIIKSKTDIVITGQNFVGKKSIIYGLVEKICNGNIHDKLKFKEVLSLDVSKLFLLSEDRRSQAINKVVQFCNKSTNNILFVENSYDINSNYEFCKLFKFLSSNVKINVITTMLTSDYEKISSQDNYFKNRLTIFEISPLSRESTFIAVKNKCKEYEEYYDLTISDKCISRIINLSEKYIVNENLPYKALKIAESVFAKYSNIYGSKNDNLRKITLLAQEYKEIESTSYNEAKLNDISKQIDIISSYIEKNGIIDSNTIDMVLAEKYNIPAKKLFFDNDENLIELKNNLSKDFVGHEKMIDELYNSISKGGKFNADFKPMQSFLFLGPEGSGKFTLAKSIAKNLFGDTSYLFSADLKNENDFLSLADNITSFTTNTPYCVIYLSNFEYASNEIKNLFLNIINNGSITNKNGKNINFANVIIVVSGTVGIDIDELKYLDFTLTDEEYSDYVMQQSEKITDTKFFNKFDKVFFFKPVTDCRSVAKILKCKLNEIIDEILSKYNLKLKFTKFSIQYLMESFNPLDNMKNITTMDKFLNNNVISVLVNEIQKNSSTFYKYVVFDYMNGEAIIKFMESGNAKNQL